MFKSCVKRDDLLTDFRQVDFPCINHVYVHVHVLWIKGTNIVNRIYTIKNI